MVTHAKKISLLHLDRRAYGHVKDTVRKESMTKRMMDILHIAIDDIPTSGKKIVVDDASVWDKPIQELHIDCQVVVPIRLSATVLPIEGGCLVRGKLTGKVVQVCDLCAEDAPVTIEHEIDTFESIPGESIPFEHEEDAQNEDIQDALQDVESHVFVEKNVPYLDMASLAWEEFMLALPMRPLCRDNCAGLCTHCGVNLNDKSCTCVQNEGDPRLAALRNLKILPK